MTQNNQLPRSTPEAQGVSSAAILAFVREAEANIHELHSLMLLRRGQVVAEGWWSPYGPQYPHILWSLSKSFTSTAVGLAVAEGRLSVDDPVLSFFPAETPAEVGDNLAAMRVRHLLSMSTGHAEDTTDYLFDDEDGNWARAFLARPVEHEPGTHFVYNSGATYMLSAIVQKLTGQTLLDYLRPRLFEPLGIANPAWKSCPHGINLGGWGLSITTEDIARFGQLYLQRGVWCGQQLVPEAWVAEATARQVANGSKKNSDWEQGYSYQFWRCRHGAYRGDGAFGQFCLVMPDQETVLALTAGVQDMQAVLNLVWECLLPALGPGPLPENKPAQAELTQKLAGLALRPPSGENASPLAAKLSGRSYRFRANKQKIKAVSFDFGPENDFCTIWDDQGERRVAVGRGAWLKGTTRLDGDEPQPVAAWGAWPAEDTYVVKLCFYQTQFCPTLTCRFDEDRLLFTLKENVSFGPSRHRPLVGRVA